MDEEFSSALLTGRVLLASEVGRNPAKPAERSARPMPISLPQEASSLPTGSDQRTILACTRPLLVGHAVELATAQPPPTTTTRSKPTPRLAQHRLRQPRARGSDSDRRRAGHGPSGRPRRPRPSQPHGGLPHRPRSRTSLRPDTADAATHRHRTPDSGRRTADAGQRTLDAQTPSGESRIQVSPW